MKWTLHHPLGKRIDDAATISESEAGNSQNENPNKAFQVTAHKASPNLNADVGRKQE